MAWRSRRQWAGTVGTNFGCNVSEDLIKGAADAMVSSGMKDAGYEYVVIDDCWQVSRDASGNIVVDAQRFPSGHQGARGLRSLEGSEVWHLFRRRCEDVRRTSRQRAATNIRTRCNTRRGASTI